MNMVANRVVYGIHGVCDVKAVETKKIDHKEVTYLVLEPVGQPESRYLVPTHNAAAMGKLKRMFTKKEMETLLMSEQGHTCNWNQNDGIRKQNYREMINSGDREQIVAMLHALYLHKEEQAAIGRKLHLCDENFLKDAEKLIAGEISVVMEMDIHQAVQYLRQILR